MSSTLTGPWPRPSHTKKSWLHFDIWAFRLLSSFSPLLSPSFFSPPVFPFLLLLCHPSLLRLVLIVRCLPRPHSSSSSSFYSLRPFFFFCSLSLFLSLSLPALFTLHSPQHLLSFPIPFS
ncbi:hypothetical protein BKA57DRAFT_160554 [Linnemannia elongata]|nr:hypothetical protein BKA57DRAFT_160554 [Linnemannia elongata]